MLSKLNYSLWGLIIVNRHPLILQRKNKKTSCVENIKLHSIFSPSNPVLQSLSSFLHHFTFLVISITRKLRNPREKTNTAPQKMDGLIPLVYKAIKRNKTRRHYKVLLPSDTTQNFNIADFYVDGYVPQYSNDQMVDHRHSHHRRYKSTGDVFTDYAYSYPSSSSMKSIPETSGGGHGGGGSGSVSPLQKPKPELLRFRSHRMFSCVTGA